MPYSRMFTASCDSCSKDYDEGHWWKEQLKTSLKAEGWKATDSKVVCPDCQ